MLWGSHVFLFRHSFWPLLSRRAFVYMSDPLYLDRIGGLPRDSSAKCRWSCWSSFWSACTSFTSTLPDSSGSKFSCTLCKWWTQSMNKILPAHWNTSTEQLHNFSSMFFPRKSTNAEVLKLAGQPLWNCGCLALDCRRSLGVGLPNLPRETRRSMIQDLFCQTLIWTDVTGRIEGKTKQGTLCILCISLHNASKYVIIGFRSL